MAGAPSDIGPLDAARWQAVLDSARDAIISIDATGTITLFNRMAESMFGHAAADVIGRNVAVLMPSPYREEHDRYIRSYQTTGVAQAIGRVRRVQGVRRSGEVFPIELSVAEGRAGDEIVYTAIIRDATDRQRLEAELETRVRQQAAVAELGLRALDRDRDALMHRVVTVVSSTLDVEYCKVLQLLPDGENLLLRAGVGWRGGEVGRATVGAHADSQAGYTLASDTPVIVRDLRAETRFRGPALLEEHGVVSGVSVIIHGRERPFGILGAHSLHPRTFTADDVYFLQATANLLAAAIERHRAEAEVLDLQRRTARRERLADVGALTAKIVHDLGNPLAGLSMATQRIVRRITRSPGEPLESLRETVEQMIPTVRRLDTMVHEFKDFLREQRLDVCVIDLAVFLRELTAVWDAEAQSRGIEIALDVSPAAATVRGDPDQLRRVFDNLVKNALEAIVRTPGVITLVTSVPRAEVVRISVIDDGPGVSGADVFEIFETTKPQGTGLGLAIARQIVLAHGGTIAYTEVSPHGAAFHVDLPQGEP